MSLSSPTDIAGVLLSTPKVYPDDRGSFHEAFRASWFGDDRRWVQWNVSRSRANVLRGLHHHKLQTDYWVLVDGRAYVGLYDLRADSATFSKSLCIELNAASSQTLLIPPGVAHGFRAATDLTLMYLLDQEYTGQDEHGVLWNDPALGLDESWMGGPQPLVSARDAANPPLAEALARLGVSSPPSRR